MPILKKPKTVQERTPSKENSSLKSQKKKFKASLIIGIIMFIIGNSILVMGIIPMVSAKNVKDVEEDYDIYSNTYKSYSKGDRFVITGRITDKIKIKSLPVGLQNLYKDLDAKYIYILENSTEIFSNDDVAERGETVTVECEVEEKKIDILSVHILKAKTFYDFRYYFVPGLILAILGGALIVNFIMLRKTLTSTHVVAKELATTYSSLQTEDEEHLMYESLRAKTQATDGNQNESTPIQNSTNNQELPSTQTTSQTKIIVKKPKEKHTDITQPPPTQTTSQITQTATSSEYTTESQFKSAEISNLYRSLESEDDEMALYQSMHSSGKNEK